MRSIGKWNIKKLNEIVDDEISKQGFYPGIEDKIKERIPAAWYEIWESAWSEIDRLVGDRITSIIYKKL